MRLVSLDTLLAAIAGALVDLCYASSLLQAVASGRAGVDAAHPLRYALTFAAVAGSAALTPAASSVAGKMAACCAPVSASLARYTPRSQLQPPTHGRGGVCRSM